MMQFKLPRLENMISTIDMFQPLGRMNIADVKVSNQYNKNNTYNPVEVFNDYPIKINRYKANSHKVNDDYEIFLENDPTSAEKCNKEKVKVYFDKNKRKIRSAPYRFKPSDYCERY